MLKMSITGDTVKYLGFTLSRCGALSPQDSTCIETRLFRSNPSDHHGRVPSYHHYHLLSVWLSSCNLVGQGRAHMPCGCTRSFMTRTSQISLFLGGFPQVRYTREAIEMGPVYPLNITHSFHSTQMFHSLSCFIKQKHKSKT